MVTVISGGTVFNPFLLRFEEVDVVVGDDGRVVHVGDSSPFKDAAIHDVRGMYVVPGLIDIHFHIESSFLTPPALSVELVRHGTLTIVADPHEIANACGVEGVLKLVESSRGLPVTAFFQIPSCVPATEFEDGGHRFGLSEWAKLAELEEVIAVGEVMCYERLLKGDEELAKLIELGLRRGLVIEGHCPRFRGLKLSLYAYRGPTSDHTQMDADLVVERVRKGVFVEIQEKSLSEEVVDVLNELPPGTYALVTDDVDAAKLISEGHLDHLIRRAVSLGLGVEKALHAATLSPAVRMGLRDRGALTPGRVADAVVVSDPERFDVVKVFKEGRLVYDRDRGVLVTPVLSCRRWFPESFFSSVKVRYLTSEDFRVRAPVGEGPVRVNVIEVLPNTTFTRRVVEVVDVVNGEVAWGGRGLALVAVFNRYGGGRYSVGLVMGAMARGAVATTYSHDSHNLLVLGVDVSDLVTAANYVIRSQGGIAVASGGRVVASLDLPVGGILSCGTAEEVGGRLRGVRDALEELGYKHFDPLKSITTLTLTVSPELRITPRGLFDVSRNRLIGMFEGSY